MYLKIDKTNVIAYIIIMLITIAMITFVSYNAGFGDGRKTSYLEGRPIPCMTGYKTMEN